MDARAKGDGTTSRVKLSPRKKSSDVEEYNWTFWEKMKSVQSPTGSDAQQIGFTRKEALKYLFS